MFFSHVNEELLNQIKEYIANCTQFTIIPEPTTYPEHVYQCYIPDYSFKFENQMINSGHAGTVQFIEV